MKNFNTTTEVLTLGEARRRLEDVRPVVERIMKTVADVREVDSDLKDVQESQRSRGLLIEALKAKRRQLEDEFRDQVTALNTLGAVLKDPEIGLIDFYTWKDDDVVFLCWHYGEETIRYWHRITDGFPGRKPVDENES